MTVAAGGDAGAFDGLEHVAHSFRVVVVRAVCCLERGGYVAGGGEALQLRASGYRGVGGARSRVCWRACGEREGSMPDGTERWVTVVIARNPVDFRKWCEVHGKNERDPNFVMASAATVRQLKDARVEITPEGMWRPDIHQIMTTLVPMLEAKARQKVADMGWGGDPPGPGARQAPTQRSFDRL